MLEAKSRARNRPVSCIGSGESNEPPLMTLQVSWVGSLQVDTKLASLPAEKERHVALMDASSIVDAWIVYRSVPA